MNSSFLLFSHWQDLLCWKKERVVCMIPDFKKKADCSSFHVITLNFASLVFNYKIKPLLKSVPGLKS